MGAAVRGSPPPQEWALWELMTKIYGQRWIAKNGNRPSDLWAAQVNSMTSEQLTRVCSAFADKCRAGSHWPPDLAEFVAVTAECSGGSFGLTVDDVLAENKRWRNEFYRYSCAETFEWRHPVLYHICIALKRIGIERKLTERELRAQAAKSWSAGKNGLQVDCLSRRSVDSWSRLRLPRANAGRTALCGVQTQKGIV